MDDLEANPLYKAFLTKFRREFDIACKMSYIIAIPHSDTLDNIIINQFLANSHILMPSKLLKMHYTPLQQGYTEDIEIEGNKLIVYLGKQKFSDKIIVDILAEEIGYNVYNREFRTILISKPLLALTPQKTFIRSILAPLSPSSSFKQKRKHKPPKPLTDHDNCLKYLELISQEITMNLENDVKLLQSKYMILSHYIEDAAMRIKNLAESYVTRYEMCLLEDDQDNVCNSVKESIEVAVENYIVHLLHGKLIVALYHKHEREDKILEKKYQELHKSRLTICQLGAQSAFSDFTLNEEILKELERLPLLQSPLAMVSSLMKLVNLISESLNQSVKFKDMMGEYRGEKVSICSDDLIASFVYSLYLAKPQNLYSTSKYLETFGWSSNAKEQAAYYTATFQIVIQYVFSFTENEVEPTNKTIQTEMILDLNKSIDSNKLVQDTNRFIDSLDSRESTATENGST